MWLGGAVIAAVHIFGAKYLLHRAYQDRFTVLGPPLARAVPSQPSEGALLMWGCYIGMAFACAGHTNIEGLS